MARRPASAINVLFTSVGRRVELIRCFRRAYRTLGLDGNIVGLDIDPLAPALQAVDRPYLVPRLSSPDYVPTLAEICQREGIALIFPLIDEDIPGLIRHRELIEASGARISVVPAQAAQVTADKWRTTQFFRSLDLATPATWLPRDFDPASANYPLFLKPRNGNGGKHTHRVDNARELTFFLDYVPDPLIQELLPGPEITNDVVCDLDGTLLGIVSRQRIEVRNGEVAKGVTVRDPGVLAACVRIARALPAVGPITVQCMMRDGVPHFTEINARLGGGIPLAIAAGVDAPLLLLTRAAGLPIDIPALGSYQTGLYLTRFDDSFLLTESARAYLESQAVAISSHLEPQSL